MKISRCPSAYGDNRRTTRPRPVDRLSAAERRARRSLPAVVQDAILWAQENLQPPVGVALHGKRRVQLRSRHQRPRFLPDDRARRGSLPSSPTSQPPTSLLAPRRCQLCRNPPPSPAMKYSRRPSSFCATVPCRRSPIVLLTDLRGTMRPPRMNVARRRVCSFPADAAKRCSATALDAPPPGEEAGCARKGRGEWPERHERRWC